MQASNDAPVVIRHRGILGGKSTFRGTRVPVEVLFENLAEGYSIDEIIYNYPTLDRGEVEAALVQACEALRRAAPDVTSADTDESTRARVPG